jgi:hypothetical protein
MGMIKRGPIRFNVPFQAGTFTLVNSGLFPQPETVTQYGRGGTRVVFTIGGAFLYIQESVIAAEFYEDIAVADLIVQTNISLHAEICTVQLILDILHIIERNSTDAQIVLCPRIQIYRAGSGSNLFC